MELNTNRITSLDLLSTDKVYNQEYIGNLFISFLNNYRGNGVNYYQKLHDNIIQDIFFLQVDLACVNYFSSELYSLFISNPSFTIEACEASIVKSFSLQNFQLLLSSNLALSKIRDLKCENSNKILKIQGIVVSASSPIVKPKTLYLQCRNCQNIKKSSDGIPRSCDNPECPVDPYFIVTEKCKVADVQYIKIQELFQDIPIGETPRHFSVVLENNLTNRISPGSQVKITGIFCIKNNKDNSFPFIRALGLENTKEKLKKAFTEEEQIFFKDLSKKDIYALISRSIAPSIFGKEDVKKALACMLFGGTRRVKSDKISLRGDINILLLGDPGIAKSQFLKFIERVSPISVYTSGKGSSAAGLTASVIKDKNNEFYLEGGALVLADKGICCIDEFDKMNENDRVAIHEAMEQQTISIAKAGITTVLNTRTSILAAANPIFGKYDDLKTPGENIEFGSTILSRFDCIFILKDKSTENDRGTAEHVLNLHLNEDVKRNKKEAVLSIEELRNYVQYAKANVFPTLGESAAKKLNQFYVNIRQQLSDHEKQTSKKSTVPLTIRQLEAIIRLSESLAKMELSQTVSDSHVDEAIRIFQLSTMNAVSQGHQIEGMYRPEFFSQINEVILKIKEIMPIGSTKKYLEILNSVNNEEFLVKKAVDYLVLKNKLISKDHGKTLIRIP